MSTIVYQGTKPDIAHNKDITLSEVISTIFVYYIISTNQMFFVAHHCFRAKQYVIVDCRGITSIFLLYGLSLLVFNMYLKV